VENLDRLTVEPYEIPSLMRSLITLVPSARAARLIRVFQGVRPLFKEKSTKDDREISRGFVLIDHEERDGVQGLVSIVGGKMSTYRLMAEKTVDLVCQKLGVSTPCTTHLEPLPSSRKHGFLSLRERLRKLDPEKRRDSQKDQTVCECELVTRREIEEFINEMGVSDLDTIRAQTRMGTGPCQGAFCAYRTLGVIAEMEKLDNPPLNQALKNFLEQRWRGIKPIVGGDQLREEQLTEGIYAGIFNLDKGWDLIEDPTSEN
jgi:glycerol-3-phosphate dehydrogenase